MIFDDTKCSLGEGPLWHPLREQLFWFDINGHRLHTLGQMWQFETFVSAAGWIDEDRLLIASASELFQFNLQTGERRSLCPLEAENPKTRSNDGRADPQGGFWIGTMGQKLEPHAGAIYRFYKGELREIRVEISVSNSICFSPDGTAAFYTDTPTQKIMKQPLDENGWPTGELTTFIDLTGTDYRPDGSVIDADGNLWNAQYGASRVAVYDPNGVEIDSHSFPASQTTCPAFGGKDLSTLYCTSAAQNVAGADDGKTFALQTKTTGQMEHRILL